MARDLRAPVKGLEALEGEAETHPNDRRIHFAKEVDNVNATYTRKLCYRKDDRAMRAI